MIPTERPPSPPRSSDSLQLSITDKVVLRAEGRVGIIVAGFIVIAVAGIWIAGPSLPPRTTDSIAGSK